VGPKNVGEEDGSMDAIPFCSSWFSPHTYDKFRHLAKVVDASGVELLGGSVTLDPDFASKVALSREQITSDGIKKVLQLLGHEDPQFCLLLLRACLGMVKLVYCLRTTDPRYLEDVSNSVFSVAFPSFGRRQKLQVYAFSPAFDFFPNNSTWWAWCYFA